VLNTYFAHDMLIGPYGTAARLTSNANHFSPDGTVQTAKTIALNNPQNVENDIMTGRLRQ
jgi:hypothetical protein